MMLKIGYLTKRRDACYWLRILTPSSILISRGHQVLDELMEQHLFCIECKTGSVIEVPWTAKNFSCPKCSALLMTPERQKEWKDSIENLIESSDVVCFQRPTSKEAVELIRYAKSRGKKTVQICDDNYIDIPTWNTGYAYYTERRAHIEESLREVDALDVTVPYLVERYSQYNSNITVLPNCHDKDILDASPTLPRLNIFNEIGAKVDQDFFFEAKEKNKVIFWGGSPTHEKDLELLVSSIRRVSRQEKVVFAFVGYVHRAIIEMIPKGKLFLFSLVPNTLYFSLCKTIGAQIGLAPAVEDPFNQGKSNLRVLEYCFFNVLPVSSDYVTYAGAAPQGLYAKNDDYSWYKAISQAIRMDQEEVSFRLAENRKYAEEHYDISVRIGLWENFFEKLTSGEE